TGHAVGLVPFKKSIGCIPFPFDILQITTRPGLNTTVYTKVQRGPIIKIKKEFRVEDITSKLRNSGKDYIVRGIGCVTISRSKYRKSHLFKPLAIPYVQI